MRRSLTDWLVSRTVTIRSGRDICAASIAGHDMEVRSYEEGNLRRIRAWIASTPPDSPPMGMAVVSDVKRVLLSGAPWKAGIRARSHVARAPKLPNIIVSIYTGAPSGRTNSNNPTPQILTLACASRS